MESVIFNKKLPLVLDLDDTLVRLVGDGNDRHVPESEAHRCKSILSLLSNKLTWAKSLDGNRVVALSDGRRVVLTERVHEFLDWAQNFYEISVCSLG